MPRFHFDVDDGQSAFCDDDGHHLPNVDHAGTQAARTLAEMVKCALDRAPCQDMTISVRDESGSSVLRARLTLAVERVS
jgi:hypothetical protein